MECNLKSFNFSSLKEESVLLVECGNNFSGHWRFFSDAFGAMKAEGKIPKSTLIIFTVPNQISNISELGEDIMANHGWFRKQK